MRCRDFLPYRIQCCIVGYGDCFACRGCRSACRGRPADKSLAVRSDEAVCGKRIGSRGNACDLCHCARTAVCIEADGVGCGRRCGSAYRYGCFYNREAGGDILKGLAGDKFQFCQPYLKRTCRARVNGAFEGCYHGVCRAFIICRGSRTVYDMSAGCHVFREGNIVKAECRLQPCCKTARACNISQTRRNIQHHLD